jgi:hypothetical protein
VLDQEVGVVPNFPIFLLVLPGILLTASRRWLALHVPVALVVVPYAVGVCSFPAWFGAWSPPARFMAVVLPMLAGYVAVAIERANRVVLAFAGVAVGYAGVLTASAVFAPDGGFSAQSGRNPSLTLLGALTHLHLTGWVPSSAVGGQRLLFAVWLAGVVAVGVAVRLSGRTTASG